MFQKEVVEHVKHHDVINKVADLNQSINYKVFGYSIYKKYVIQTNEIIGSQISVGFKNNSHEK